MKKQFSMDVICDVKITGRKKKANGIRRKKPIPHKAIEDGKIATEFDG